MSRKRWRHRLLPLMAGLLLGTATLPASAAENRASADLAGRGCATLAARVDAMSGDGPVFLTSHEGAAGSGPAEAPALATAAFTYDNALASIALVACGHRPQARRIGLALAAAALHDRAGPAGRLRNAYRGGPQPENPPPNGWWDPGRGQWLEDGYQTGTATGNVAWAALALLTLADHDRDPRFRDAAIRLGQWVLATTRDRRGAGGFIGGIHGDGPAARRLEWKATEHNVDLIALFQWLERDGATGGNWTAGAATARALVVSQWEATAGRFLTGTLPDGLTPNRATSGLDAQVWPLLLPDAPAEWRRALVYAERAHGVSGGFSFNDDRSGLWSEGTAQAALAYRVTGQPERAEALLSGLAGLISPGGYLWATPQARITTGLAIGPDSTEADLVYERRPHLGATAWAVIAATGWNPFVGHRIAR